MAAGNEVSRSYEIADNATLIPPWIKRRFWKVTRSDLGSVILEDKDAIEELNTSLEADAIGSQIVFEIVEMKQSEFDALPGFESW